ncbi:MAG: DUF1800 family protein [Chthoniobacterales bacterium]
MKPVTLVSALLCAAAFSGMADSKLSEFRQSFRGSAVLSTDASSISGTSVATFNASKYYEHGRLEINATFRNGAEVISLPASLRFNGRRAALTLGSGGTAIRGMGRATLERDIVTFSIAVDFSGTPARVTGNITRKSHGLKVAETIALQNTQQKLNYNLKSKQPPGSDPSAKPYSMPDTGGGDKGGAVPGAISWDNDAAALVQSLTGSQTALRVEAVVPTAYEKEDTYALFRVSRMGGKGELPVDFDIVGNSDSRKGSASPADYRLQVGANIVASHHIVIPAGSASMDIKVLPVADGLHEVPETIGISLRPGANYQLDAVGASAVATISDAADTPENDNIFIAYLAPASGVTSSATGISTAHLHGGNDIALVDLTFSGLTSSQSAAHINAPALSGSGPDIKGLPRGQVTGSSWTIAAAQFLTTDQSVLDALYSGQISINVLTGDYPDGEIRGNYVMSTGSADPPLPLDPPAEGALSGETLRRDVARFLMQATFGPTQAEIDSLAADIESRGGDSIAGYSAWIDAQFALEQTRLLDYVQAADAQEWAQRGTDPINYATNNEPGTANRRRGWWTLAVKANDELRQRVAFALSEIFVVSEATDEEVLSRHYGAANYYDMLARSADGDYRALLGEVSRSPIMGKYLSSLKNQKAIVDKSGKVIVSPDENYAREVMQLFSIGLVQLNADGSVKLNSSGSPTPTYTNADITDLARVLTGWSFSKSNGSKASGYPVQDNTNFNAGYGPQYFQAAWLNPMKNFATYHDTGSKVVLGTTIPSGLTGDQDLDTALDILANHPNTAPFVSRLLIQRLVTSNPSAGYIYRVAKVFDDDGTGHRGNLKAVVKAILLDHEARNGAAALAVGHGKQKEPILRYVQLLRAFNGASKLPLSDLSAYGYPADQLDNFPAGVTRYRYPNTDTPLAQSPLRSPTVFNWFLPGYSPPGALAAAGLVAPEMQLTTETQVPLAVNYNRTFTESDTGQGVNALFNATDNTLDDVKIDRSPQVNEYKSLIAAGKTVREAVTAVVDDLDLLLAGGRLKERYESAAVPNPRSIIIDTAVATTEGATSNDRVKVIAYLVSNSPTFLHQP